MKSLFLDIVLGIGILLIAAAVAVTGAMVMQFMEQYHIIEIVLFGAGLLGVAALVGHIARDIGL